MIGRGKICTDAVGNRRLRVLASTFLDQYAGCRTKVEKTEVVSQLVQIVRDGAHGGAFVKQINGRWWEMDGPTGKSRIEEPYMVRVCAGCCGSHRLTAASFFPFVARTKVGYVLRDLLFAKYRSSSKAKVARRRAKRLKERAKSPPEVGPKEQTIQFDDGSTITTTNDKPVISTQFAKHGAGELSKSVKRHVTNNAESGCSAKNNDVRLTPLLEDLLRVRIARNPQSRDSLRVAFGYDRSESSSKANPSATPVTASPLGLSRFEALYAAYDRILDHERTRLEPSSLICSWPRHQALDLVCGPIQRRTQEDDLPDDISDIFDT